MSAPGGSGRWVRWGLPLVAALAVMIGVLAPARSASAHPLDQYLQISYITVDPTQITVEIAFTPGVLLAPDALPKIDGNGDEVISEAEAQAYAQTIVDALSLSVDGEPVALSMTTVSMPAYLVVQAGYGETKIVAVGQLPAGTTGTHELSFSNSFEPSTSKYQVNGFVDDSSTVQLGTQDRSDDQQSMKMAFTIGGATTASSEASSAQVDVGTSLAGAGQAQRLMGYFESSSNTPTALLVALAIALMLGSLHALTPGHGKTLVAAYLVGSRGTVKHAVALGAIVTFTHTSSVIAIGVIALFASHYIMPSVLVPALEVISGLLVVFLGGRLIWSRWQTYRAQKRHDQEHAYAHEHGPEHSHDHAHDHVHPHVHEHSHADGVMWHDHGDGHVHSHAMPESVTARSLLAMGISGGMVPCPEALGIMIIAIGLHRIALGLGLIVSFSVGLAAVLIGIGILLVRSRMLMERFGLLGSRLTGAVIPLASAVIVTVLGVGIMLGGLSSYLG